MKVKDISKAAAVVALLTVMWIVPAVAGQLGDRHDTEMLDQGEVTLSSGTTSVTLTAPEGFERVVANSDSSIELVRDDHHVYLKLSSGVENPDAAIERGRVILNRTVGETSWSGKDITSGDGSLSGKACTVHLREVAPCAVVGASDVILTVVSTSERGRIDVSVDPAQLLSSAKVES
ncbi:hypothetical protein [Corynebacterium rouxii]|uniref:hypothetical protein n=1 Tax=Corynebacterium rouxii TaxID=2719119 RepID=UPI00313BC7A3